MAEKDKEKKRGIGRRDFLKAAATTPVVGAFTYSIAKKESCDKAARQKILDKADVTGRVHPFISKQEKKLSIRPGADKTINIGYIGVGGRGKSLMRFAGFYPPEEGQPVGLEGLEPLNIRCTAVCDLFKPNIEWALKAARGNAKAYSSYQELLEKSDVDAVVIATTDQWHGPAAIAAAKAGKHVYVEKCMTYNIEETFQLRDAVKKSGIVLQLGHQGRHSSRYKSVMDVIAKGMLGHVSLIHCYTCRNSNDGAWFRGIPKEHGPISAPSGARNVDWDQFISNMSRRPYDPNHFFNWQCYKDYSTGLPGLLASHDIDAVCMVMQLGIPATATASGGVYHYKDFIYHMKANGEPLGTDEPLPAGAVARPDVPVLKREMPDVFQVIYEWPDKDLTVVYNATLSSSFSRGQIYMGDEAAMDLTKGVDIYADPRSKRYADLIESGEVQPDKPMISYMDMVGGGAEAITSATSQWAVSRGLLYTYRGGRVVNTAYLHIKDWLDHIRAGDQDTMCNIDDGFQVAIATHMANLSYQTGCRVRWDNEEEKLLYDIPGIKEVVLAQI
ncbi:MAG: Gfo/Idh/MocA family oxidoreductase [Gemmatimonadota bacterium]|nr:Gfo/Idh/MocA family oxidoreductase [Gemmatimonadota bacterium]